ncbi:MAG TPA: zeta toxin family protein [Patescibacteria group bacterium]|nr:zeta toxin family protein [Patescibacteria group bacterium]
MLELNEEEKLISDKSHRWLQANQSKLLQTFADRSVYVPDRFPISLFMAGSPGAGKTEISKRLATRFTQQPIRIDADEIRLICPGYTGKNAQVFQSTANKGVNILYDYALKQRINLILDGTFAYKNSHDNIQRSLDKGRKVEIFYVYQDLLQAWDLTKKREILEGRRVPKEVFIYSFFQSLENVKKAKVNFGKSIMLNLVIKDLKLDVDQIELDIQNIDDFLVSSYTQDDLELQLL